ncbi:cytochrome c3 family protein [uncultured Sutterella sp.]|uniref:cytochrome c3 family protein n=1 Tax=uncultured Sutterella sp. TaxID=286133 RepID=UPI0025CDFD0A|nr:cytochrome c3 family protein [uncultured Sutterella sp.]
MQFNHFAAAVLTAGALALLSISPAGAADRKFLADRHVERGVACASCHGTDAPKPGAQVSTAQCNTCHGSLDAVAKRTAKLDPNPHYNHLVGLDCAECHRGHAKSVNMCAQCHNIKYSVP